MSGTSRFNFTKTSLLALPAAAAGPRVTHYDSKTRGLTLVVTTAGVKTFYVRRKIDRTGSQALAASCKVRRVFRCVT